MALLIGEDTDSDLHSRVDPEYALEPVLEYEPAPERGHELALALELEYEPGRDAASDSLRERSQPSDAVGGSGRRNEVDYSFLAVHISIFSGGKIL